MLHLFVPGAKRRIPLLKQELLTLLIMMLPSVLNGFRDIRSLVFCVVFCRSLFVLCLLTIASFLLFGHCVVCPSICEFWLPLWYIKTPLPYSKHTIMRIQFTNLILVKSPIQRLWESFECVVFIGKLSVNWESYFRGFKQDYIVSKPVCLFKW